MTNRDSHTSVSDETGRPQASSGPGSGQQGSIPDDFLYDAFISYSRDNLQAADKIERDLQAFTLPREIRKRLGRRHLNVFRDVSDLTGNRLDPALEHNLEQSRTLVVLCSPAARRSRYVSMEINRFAQLREAEKIFPVLVAGEPNNDLGVDAADWAFPNALSDVLGAYPLAADLRRAWSGKAKLAAGSPWVQLVAGIVGATTDDLTERIARQNRRRWQSIEGILMVVLAIVSVLGLAALDQRNEARHQRNEARHQRDRAIALRLTSEGESMLAGGKGGGSVRALDQILAAQDVASTADDGALFTAVGKLAQTLKIIETPAAVWSVALSPDGHRIASGAADNTIRLWNTDTGQPVSQPLTGHQSRAVGRNRAIRRNRIQARTPIPCMGHNPDRQRTKTHNNSDVIDRCYDCVNGGNSQGRWRPSMAGRGHHGRRPDPKIQAAAFGRQPASRWRTWAPSQHPLVESAATIWITLAHPPGLGPIRSGNGAHHA